MARLDRDLNKATLGQPQLRGRVTLVSVPATVTRLVDVEA